MVFHPVLRDLRDVLLVAPCGAFLYYLTAAVCARRFFTRLRRSAGVYTPGVSILKPVRGVDRQAYENFASFCRLDYPDYEILFGVSNPNDPVIPIIQKLIRTFPERHIRLCIGMGTVGSNDKASILACLSRSASHDLFVISDSDTRVTPDYLRAVTAPFRDPNTGAVTCVYRGTCTKTFGDTMEALGISSEFFGGVFIAEQFAGARFALGATMAITRRHVKEIGGFEALAEFLLDDFELGRRVASLGYRVELIPYTVSLVLPSQSFRGFWQRQLRWAIGLRRTSPWAHLGLLFTQGLPLAVLGAAVCHSVGEAGVYLFAYVATRYSMAYSVGIWGLRDTVMSRKWWLVPVRDALAFAAWLASFPNRRVRWRGQAFRVRDGRLAPDEAAQGR